VGRKPRRKSTTSKVPGSGVKVRPRIDAILERSDVRAFLDEAKLHFALAAGIDHAAEPERHRRAAEPAAAALWRVVAIVRSDPGNAKLPSDAVYHHVLNRAYAELTAPVATEEQRRQHYLSVYLPAGRPPTRRSRARQRLLDEIRARPDMPDYLIKDRAARLGVWAVDQADDLASVSRRIRRLRRDATN
jgi:hypothetical protein